MTSSNQLKCDMFGGENGEQCNALMSALIVAAGSQDVKDNECIYSFLALPKTSLIVELVDALNKLGYKIIKP
ncbi:MAG: hypothetical protein NTZ18_03770 [Candidatus Komeilibacteria bacterium]|nr:hypothetical protein [Candidatus Komeilibacteria bacterium]